MIYKERLLKIIRTPYVSEKASAELEKHNTIVLKVKNDSTKLEIKNAIYKLFAVEVNHVNILLVKGKIKKRRQYISRWSNWKKAYVTLKEGQSLELFKKIESIKGFKK